MSNYWRRRADEIEAINTANANIILNTAKRAYEKAIQGVIESIDAIYSKFKNDNQLSFDEANKLLSISYTIAERDRLLAIYAQTNDDTIRQMLDGGAYAGRISGREAVLNRIIAECINLGIELNDRTKQMLENNYTGTYNRYMYSIQKSTGYGFDFKRIDDEQVRQALRQQWHGGNYSSRLWGDTDKLAKDLQDIITTGLLNGISYSKLVDELELRTGVSRSNANRIIRTESAFVCSGARTESYKEAELEQYIFIATLDLKTSEICRKLDGKIFNVKDAQVGVNKAPMHPHCRSTDGAYISGKDRSKLQRRARDKNGNSILVPQNMTYQEWYNKYIAGVQ